MCREQRTPQAFYWGILHPLPCWAPVPWRTLLDGKEKDPLLPKTAQQTQPLVAAWPPLLQPGARFPHIHLLEALLLRRALTSLYCQLLISLCPMFAGWAPILPCAHVHPHGPRAPAPMFFLGGGALHSPASSGGTLSGTQVSYYSLLEGYYRLTHLENYSFFRPFRNFNELF